MQAAASTVPPVSIILPSLAADIIHGTPVIPPPSTSGIPVSSMPSSTSGIPVSSMPSTVPISGVPIFTPATTTTSHSTLQREDSASPVPVSVSVNTQDTMQSMDEPLGVLTRSPRAALGLNLSDCTPSTSEVKPSNTNIKGKEAQQVQMLLDVDGAFLEAIKDLQRVNVSMESSESTLVFMFILFVPFHICYRSSRYFFLASLKRIIFAPLYKVVMADFFLADQLTSQVYMFRNAEYLMCYYITGHLKWSSDACTSDNINYQAFAYLISLLPYWWRIMQCFRRWVDEHDKMHLANGGKYLSATVAAAVSLTYHNEMSKGWMVMSITCSTLATAFQLYWDFVIDWGLLRTKSKNYLLRDQLILERKAVYFVSMVLNSFLRLAWLQSITRIEISNIDRRITDFLFASLEVIRRGHWNFYRLENEHLNNVGKFRAIKTVPLPFRAIENDA
ncbi:hypothetical protein L7F22_005771 [Adiantum nelumboides]|nr:hypothetical protein [Adiantum nelumboides]